jgi:hypothetical protein
MHISYKVVKLILHRLFVILASETPAEWARPRLTPKSYIWTGNEIIESKACARTQNSTNSNHNGVCACITEPNLTGWFQSIDSIADGCRRTSDKSWFGKFASGVSDHVEHYCFFDSLRNEKSAVELMLMLMLMLNLLIFNVCNRRRSNPPPTKENIRAMNSKNGMIS